MIPYGRQDISEGDIEAVVRVLRSDYLTTGPVVPRFEEAVARRVGADYAVAVNSATSALHLACAAFGLGANDWLWTVPNTFVASANAALYCGASVDFVDIDPKTYSMDPDALAAKLDSTPPNRHPRIIMPVAMGGQSAAMAQIAALARRCGARLIEDASHAIGANYEGRPVGACDYAEITVFSFHPVKIITTGEGGMALTNQPDLARRMALLRSHGITRDPGEMTEPSHGPWYYQQIDLGWNYRMTDLQAALGLSQLDRLDSFIDRRREIADRYDRLFRGSKVVRPGRRRDADSAWHLYIVRVPEKLHRRIFDGMRAAGIGVQLHYIPVHLQPYYHAMGFREGDFPVSEAYYRSAISLPIFSGLTDAQVDEVASCLLGLI